MKQSTKYVALDVHQATSVASVREESGRVIARTILPTESTALVEFFGGMRGAIHVAFEEGTQAQWLHDLLLPVVDRVPSVSALAASSRPAVGPGSRTRRRVRYGFRGLDPDRPRGMRAAPRLLPPQQLGHLVLQELLDEAADVRARERLERAPFRP